MMGNYTYVQSYTPGERCDPLILGHGQSYSSDSRKTQLNNNVITVGPSGSGKTYSIMEPNMGHNQYSTLVVVLSKRELVEKYMEEYRQRGFEVYDLNLAHPEKSKTGYDPMRGIRNYSDIKHQSMSVVMADPQKERSQADPYWDKGGVSLMNALTAYVMMTKSHPCYADVLDLLDGLEMEERNGIIRTNLDEKFERIKMSDPACFAVTNWRTFKQLPIRTASCIFSTLHATVDEMFSPELRKLMRLSLTVDFKDLGKRRSVLFITTSAVNPAQHRFVNMFCGHMIKDLFEFAEEQPDGRLMVPVRMMFDDFAVGSRIQNFPELISIFRAKGISVDLMLQSESQLESMYGPEAATTIINNCDTYVYLGGMDLKTCRHVSERLNVPLEDVLYMPIGQEFIFRRGQRPVVCERYRTPEDPLCQKVDQRYARRGGIRRECA